MYYVEMESTSNRTNDSWNMFSSSGKKKKDGRNKFYISKYALQLNG
jgi:hypothetical protein